MRAEKREKKNAKEKETLDNMIEEERRESILIEMKQRLEVNEQLSNGEDKECMLICNGNISSSTERNQKERVLYTRNQQETIKMDLFPPPKYTSKENLDGEFSKGFEDQKNALSPVKDNTQLRRRSLPTIALSLFRQTCNSTKKPVEERRMISVDTTSSECIDKSKTSSKSEHNVRIEFGDVDMADTGTTYLWH